MRALAPCQVRVAALSGVPGWLTSYRAKLRLITEDPPLPFALRRSKTSEDWRPGVGAIYIPQSGWL